MIDFHKLSADEKMTQIYMKVLSLEEAWRGDDYGNSGYKDRIHNIEKDLADHKERFEKIKRRDYYTKGIIVAVASISTFILKYGNKIADWIKF